MINFTIPATGSSGHLGGGLLLAILLGSHAAFLTISSVLVVQALFFADGGLLALGCNIFNIGFIPAFIAYPFIYKRIAGRNPGQRRMALAIMISALVCLQLGPFGVVLETYFSGISELPFSTFALFMQPIHLAIGFVEGLATVALVSFVAKARPDILQSDLEAKPIVLRRRRNMLPAVLVAAVFLGGILSWYASENPDGLEWAIAKVTGKEELHGAKRGFSGMPASLQEKVAFLPGYSSRKTAVSGQDGAESPGSIQISRLATSVSGVLGAFLTLALVFISSYLLKKRTRVA
jgi:cobalt/nickel transport system permease protein